MTATGIPTPSAIFAPVAKPSGDDVGVLVAVGEFESSSGIGPGVDTAVACGVMMMVEARANTAESDDCQKIGTPSPITFVEPLQVEIVGVPDFHVLSSKEYQKCVISCLSVMGE
jgi:hypothetical protein